MAEKDEELLPAVLALIDERVLELIAEALQQTRYGEIVLKVVGGRIVEVDYTKKFRL